MGITTEATATNIAIFVNDNYSTANPYRTLYWNCFNL